MGLSILERIAQGDQVAVSECIDCYSDLVWSLARRFLRDEIEAEDAVQEIFIDVWSSASRFDRTIASELTFIATIARRRLIDRRRARTREPQTEVFDESTVSPDEVAGRRLEHQRDITTVSRLVGNMQPEQRRALELAVYHGYSHAEVARRMELPLGTVKTHVRRGLIAIREQMQTASVKMESRG